MECLNHKRWQQHLNVARRAIAVDFQGVLFVEPAGQGLPPSGGGLVSLVARLARLLHGHDDIAVVVTSSWRAQMEEAQLLEQLPGLESWYVGSVGQPQRGRDEALRAWLLANPQIDTFVALDDHRELYKGHWPQLIVFDSLLGLNDPLPWHRLEQWVNAV